MKKLFTLALSLVLSIVCLTAYADVSEVEGLQENYDKLWLKYYEDTGIIDIIKQTHFESYKQHWQVQLTAPDSVRRKYIYDGTIEEQEEVFWEKARISYDDGFSVHGIETEKYLLQYANNNLSQYLMTTENYWAIPFVENQLTCKKYKANGDELHNEPENHKREIGMSDIADRNTQNYLKDIAKISDDLLNAGIYKVDDLKIVVVDNLCTAIYINSNEKEYLMRIHTYYYDWAPEFEMYKVYEASEAIRLITETENRFNETKPTFEDEAVALQNEGLLKGNERGLDLLKPLTRIEAVTMLLRAIGQEPTAATIKETFADVPTTHWGCAAAVKAEELGIVNGVGDNLFAPDKRVTATEFSTMVLRAAQETDFDWTQALNTLIETGIITDEDTKDMSLFTRGDMAKIIYEAMNKGLLK